MGLLLLIILILLLLSAFPRGPEAWNANWGYGPSGVLFTILIVVLILALLGQIPMRGGW